MEVPHLWHPQRVVPNLEPMYIILKDIANSLHRAVEFFGVDKIYRLPFQLLTLEQFLPASESVHWWGLWLGLGFSSRFTPISAFSIARTLG